MSNWGGGRRANLCSETRGLATAWGDGVFGSPQATSMWSTSVSMAGAKCGTFWKLALSFKSTNNARHASQMMVPIMVPTLVPTLVPIFGLNIGPNFGPNFGVNLAVASGKGWRREWWSGPCHWPNGCIPVTELFDWKFYIHYALSESTTFPESYSSDIPVVHLILIIDNQKGKCICLVRFV